MKEVEVISAIETFNDCYNFEKKMCVELCGRKFAKILVDKNISFVNKVKIVSNEEE